MRSLESCEIKPDTSRDLELNLLDCAKMALIEIDGDSVTIPEYHDYNNIENIQVVNADEITYKEFFDRFMVKNIPCIVTNICRNWECVHKWIKNDCLDYDYFCRMYGHLEAPVADCSNTKYYNSHSKTTMTINEYIQYVISGTEEKFLYLKDWHLRRLLPDDNFYEVPSIFASDWLNEFAQDHQEDDYMFVYIGPKNTWTPLHVDVYCSYSWSVNILGKKKWILFPPGEEVKLHDKFGNLPVIFNPELHLNIKYFELIQDKGDAIFVPSGWYHQVINIMDTISINHNWINSCNIQKVWEALEKNLKSVEVEIADLKNTEDFSSDCQVILKSLFGMDYPMFTSFICDIAKKRINQLKSGNTKGFNNYALGIKHIKFDLNVIAKILDNISKHPLFTNKKILPVLIENELLTIRECILNNFNT